MAKIADYTVTGKSGQRYAFGVYLYDMPWREIPAVLLVTRRTEKPNGGVSLALRVWTW